MLRLLFSQSTPDHIARPVGPFARRTMMIQPDFLLSVATSVRAFLEPRWPVWHAAAGSPPTIMSSSTCGRSSLFLQRVLQEDHGVEAIWRNGTPRFSPDSPELGPFGFFGGTSWESHAWVEVGQWIIDITGDQFGMPPVVVTNCNDFRYGVGPIDTASPEARQARLRLVEQLWPQWVASDIRPDLTN